MESDQTGGALGADAASGTTEVVTGAAAGDVQVQYRTDTGAGEPAAGQGSDASASEQADGAGSDASAEAVAAADAADRADLEQYPESVRDHLKNIPREMRKELHEHFAQREREQARIERERADKLEADRKEAEARAQAVRDRHGKFVGESPIDLRDEDGNVSAGPTYAELTQMLGTRRGRDELWSKYGLTEASAEAIKSDLDMRRETLGESAGFFENQAWAKLGNQMEAALVAVNGVDAEAVISSAMQAAATGGNAPAAIIQGVVQALEARHSREMTAQKNDYEGRIKALDVNGEALAGRVAAAESRRLATGGRSGAQTLSAAAEMQRLARENPDEFRERAIRGDFAGIDLTK